MEALGIDGKLLIAQFVNFLIFYLIFKKFIAKPLATFLKKQQDEESKRHALSMELETAKSKLDEDRKHMLQEVKAEQKKILAEAKQYGEKVKADMLAQSQKQSTEIVEAGKVAIEQEKKAAQKELAQYVREAAEIAVQKGLASYLTDDTRKAITAQVIKNIQ
jgi:F0F1-type ATP synthase membrane subunit b/b'